MEFCLSGRYGDEVGWCAQCDYNLRGNISGRCPECGWVIDWNRVARHEEDERIGTPVYRHTGIAKVPATGSTVRLMLFHPVTFARQTRWDEDLWPAALVAALASAIFVAARIFEGDTVRDTAAYAILGGALTQIVLQSTAFAALGRWRPGRLGWRQRFRLALLISLYSTCFVACWPVLEFPPVVGSEIGTNFVTPWRVSPSSGWFSADGTLFQFLLRTFAFYWWWIILGLFFVIRARPRWCGVVLTVSMPLIAFAATYVAGRIGPW